MGQDVLTAVKPGQLMVKIVHDELATLMGGETAEVNLSQNPSIILMSGLQGSGKTTFSGKLAKIEKRETPLAGRLRRISPCRYRAIKGLR